MWSELRCAQFQALRWIFGSYSLAASLSGPMCRRRRGGEWVFVLGFLCVKQRLSLSVSVWTIWTPADQTSACFHYRDQNQTCITPPRGADAAAGMTPNPQTDVLTLLHPFTSVVFIFHVLHSFILHLLLACSWSWSQLTVGKRQDTPWTLDFVPPCEVSRPLTPLRCSHNHTTWSSSGWFCSSPEDQCPCTHCQFISIWLQTYFILWFWRQRPTSS